MNIHFNLLTEKLNGGSRKQRLYFAMFFAVILYAFFHFFFKSTPLTLPIPKVMVQKPLSMPITEYVRQTGSMVAFNSVDLVARVEGYLQDILFTDGSLVKKNQPLFVIQPEPYDEKLKEAKATVMAEEASNAYTKSEYARQQRMYKENATSLNSVESWLARMQQTEAEVLKAKANEAIAAINDGYTHVAAPFDGRIGRHLVDVGNLVGNGAATVLANIEQIQPIYVYFNLNELDLIQLRAAAKRYGITSDDLKKIPVYVKMQNETDYLHEGRLDFVNTGLNASTGTMEFRAILDNKDYALLPGAFVQVKIPVTPAKNQLTIPAEAVLYDQIGAYVLTVDSENNVIQQRVTLGTVVQERIPVLKGLGVTDRVIVSGLQFATPGNKVEPHDL